MKPLSHFSSKNLRVRCNLCMKASRTTLKKTFNVKILMKIATIFLLLYMQNKNINRIKYHLRLKNLSINLLTINLRLRKTIKFIRITTMHLLLLIQIKFPNNQFPSTHQIKVSTTLKTNLQEK